MEDFPIPTKMQATLHGLPVFTTDLETIEDWIYAGWITSQVDAERQGYKFTQVPCW